MDIKTMAKKLRLAADALDELIEGQGTAAVAEKILNKVNKVKSKAVKTKIHWTQRPENRAKVLKLMRKAKRTYEAKHAH